MRVKLASCGFNDNVILAQKFFVLYKLCEEQLTKQVRLNWCYIVNFTGCWHADTYAVLLGRCTMTLAWGTSCLCWGRWGQAKERDPMTLSPVLSWECCVTWTSLSWYDKKQSKFTLGDHFGSTWCNDSVFQVDEDEPLFLSLINDLFPGIKLDSSTYVELQAAVANQVARAGVVNHPPWNLKLVQVPQVLTFFFVSSCIWWLVLGLTNTWPSLPALWSFTGASWSHDSGSKRSRKDRGHQHSDASDDRNRNPTQRNAHEPKSNHCAADVWPSRRCNKRLDRWHLLYAVEKDTESQERYVAARMQKSVDDDEY